MVKISSQTIYEEKEGDGRHFEKYPYPLSIFQKYAIKGIVEGDHVLVCAPTGSGKSLPAEFAIDFFTSQGKKVIYTSPIKALGNQKFNEFSGKYPHITFGLITGDIKINPSAQVLIMTAEILLNKMMSSSSNTSLNASLNTSFSNSFGNSFDIDINTELSCVIMDEVHYINDSERGKVWEETIMLLPPQVQMVMLSATIDAPERFAGWCETCKPNDQGKSVVLAHTYTRIVPLTHYAFIVTPTALYKSIKDKTKEEELKKNVFNKTICLQTAEGAFLEPNYHHVNNTLQLINDKQVRVKRSFVLNQLCDHLVQNDMLPALCFVLSRKRLEQCAQEVTARLLEDDSKVGYIIKRECEQIIRKLPNHQEYLRLPEYLQMVSLLEKGVAIHHAGVMPVLREMVEILYAKGFIKLLFATETFAVGLNMPTKTTIFTDVCKFDGSNNRQLFAHEYTQMAGRAGRRGIDILGHVIHLPNLYSSFALSSFKTMLSGTAQTLSSKFRISYNLIFNCIAKHGACTVSVVTSYIHNSMIRREICAEVSAIEQQVISLELELEKCVASCAYLKTPIEVIETYLELVAQRANSVNKRRKEIDRSIEKITCDHKHIEKEKSSVIKVTEKRKEINVLKDSMSNCDAYITNCVKIVIDILLKRGHLFKIETDGLLDAYIFSEKGRSAQHLKETNCLLFSELYETKAFEQMSERDIASFLSCFTSVSVPDDNCASCFKACAKDCTKACKEPVERSCSYLLSLLEEETENKIKTGINCEMHFDLLPYVNDWWDAQDEPSCKLVLQRLEEEKCVSLGEFVKALLKINNTASELGKVAETNGDVELLNKLALIPTNTLKFVATNQSLYV